MRIASSACAVFACCVVASPAFAQTVSSGPADHRSPEPLGEIVVTAQRVKSAESKTPISLEVIGGRKLEQQGAVDFQTLAEHDSSLNFDSGNGGGFITLRGVSGAGGIGPAVPIAFDGFYYNLNLIFNNAIYDIDRVEVLRGPQGTLFGRNTSGGLVNVLTNDPKKTFSAEANVSLGNYSLINADAAINLPISDRLQLRIAGVTNFHEGYTKVAGAPATANNDDRARSLRVKLAYEPIDGLAILGTFQIGHVGGTGVADTIFNLPADANGLPTHVAIPLGPNDAKVENVAFASRQDINDTLYQLKISYDRLPGGITATYLGGYDHLNSSHLTPTVGLDAPAYGVPVTAGGLSITNPRTWNHELRLTSRQDAPLTWQVGVFYFLAYGIQDTTFADYAANPQLPTIDIPFYNRQRSVAGYGQANWKLGSQTLSAGLRYTADKVGQVDLASPGDGIFPAAQATSYSKWTWHLGDEWTISDHSMVYAKADTGYRAGFFNLFVPNDPTKPSYIEPYAPEYVTAFELGTKNRLIDQHLVVNADIFYMTYSGEQLLESNQGGVVTVNAASTRIYGAEVGINALLGKLTQVDLSLNLLHARFKHQVFTNALGQNYDIGGNRLTQSPTISLSAGIEHTILLSAGRLTARVETKFQSGQYFDFYNFADSYQGAYTRTDAHLVYKADSGRWTLDVFVRNIENSRVISDESESYAPPLSQPGTYNVGFQAPRTWGVRLGLRY